MAANEISTLPTKEARQIAKLELAQTKRQQIGTQGYRENRYYDLDLLPTKYVGNDVVNNTNVGGLQQGRPWKSTPNTVLGLWRSVYNSYFGGDWTWFDANTPTSEGQVTDFSVDDVIGEYISVQWLGYFRAPHTAVYNFYLDSDDNSIFWLGDKAVTEYSDGNWDVYCNGDGEATTDPISLVAGQYYPIRVQYGNGAGPGNITLSWSDDYVLPPVIQVADLQYAGAQWTGNPGLVGATYTNAGWDYIGFNNAGLYEALFSLLNGDGRLAVTWSAGSTVTTGYVNVNFDMNGTTFQFVPVIDAAGSDNYPGTWVFPATFSAIP